MKQNKQKLLSLILAFAIVFCSAFSMSAISAAAKETETAQTSGLFDTYYLDVGDTKVITLNFNDIDYPVQSTAWVSNAPFDVEIIDQGFGYCQIRVNRYVSVKVIITCNYNYQRLNPMTNQIWLMNGAESFYVVVNEEDTPVVTPTTPNYPDTPSTSEQTLNLSTQGVYKYKIKSDGTIEITDFDVRLETSIKVPDIINGRKVTSIGRNAFEYCRKLKKVVIPEGITSIDYWCFYHCTGIEEVVLPETLESIGYEAFYYCTSLKKALIPENVTDMDNVATFGFCASLEEIIVDEDNQNFVSVDGVLYNKDKTILMQYPAGKNETYFEIPVGVTKVIRDAFVFADKLEHIVIPSTVETIGSRNFSNCQSLKSIIIPEGVTELGGQTFFRCYKLEKVYIPESVTNISSSAFEESNENLTIYGVEGSEAQNFAKNNKYNFVAVKSYTEPESNINIWPVSANSQVNVTEVADESSIDEVKVNIGNEPLEKYFYISAENSNEETEPQEDIILKIPVEDSQVKIYRVEDDGTLSEMKAYVKDGIAAFTTDRLGYFVVTSFELPTLPEETTSVIPTTEITEPSESSEPTMFSTDATEPTTEAESTTVNEPTETSTNPVEICIGILGDADDNGKITIKDATIIQKHLAKISEIAEDNIKLCDVDANDKLNIRDVTNIQKWLAKISVDCKIGEAIFSENNISATTIAPTNQAPTTLVPTTVAPTTQAPTTQPTTVAPPVETDPIEDPYDPPVYGQTYTVCFTNNKRWSGTVYAYTWDVMGGNNGEWPGQPMTHYGTNDFGEDRYTYEVQAGHTFVIFTDGTSKSVDVDLTMYTDFGFFLLDTQNSKGAFDIGNYPFV